MKLLNKKGSFLEDNFVGIIIGIVCVLLIAGLVVKLAFFFIDQDSKNAQKSLDSLMGKVDALENNENNEFLIRGVDGWYFVGFDLSDSDRPDKCFLNSCVCVCDEPKNCQEKGFCRDVEKENVEVFTESFEDEFVDPSRQAPGGGTNVVKTQVNVSPLCIRIDSKLTTIFVLKSEENLSISSKKEEYGFYDFTLCKQR